MRVGNGVVDRCEKELFTGRDAKGPKLVQGLGEGGQFGFRYVGGEGLVDVVVFECMTKDFMVLTKV
jgi:hypothetical protein